MEDFIPQRVIIGIMGFLAVVVSFLMRGSLSVAITEMVVPLNKATNTNNSIMCSIEIPSGGSSNSNTVKTCVTRYDWSQEEQGWILAAYFVGYLVTHIPGALLAQKFSGKWTLGLGVLATTIFNAACPIGVEYGGIWALIFLRFLMGLGNGTLFPSLSVLLAAWVPEKERGKLAVFVLGGPQIGLLISFYMSGLILSHFAWPVVFYFWSAVSAIWFIVFSLICYSDPASHPFISKAELNYLESGIGKLKRHEDLPPTPWKEIFTSVPILVLILSQVSNDYVFTVLASDLPKYMKEVLGLAVQDVGLYSSLPYLLMWISSLLSGSICDHLINRRYLTVTQARKLFSAFCALRNILIIHVTISLFESSVIASIFTSICILAGSYEEYNETHVIFWFTLAFVFMGNYYPGMRLNIFDLSPNYAGSIMAVTNGIGSLSAAAAPNFVGMLIPDSSLEQWRRVFWLSFGISMLQTFVYTAWASAEIQPWNEPNGYKSSQLEKLPEKNKKIRE